MSEKAKRKPDWSVCVKPSDKWRSIGAAWQTEKGNLYLRLDQGERLEGSAMLFPYREERGGIRERPAHYEARPLSRAPTPPPDDDYMERKRAERRSSAPPTPANDAIGIENPDVEPPGWL